MARRPAAATSARVASSCSFFPSQAGPKLPPPHQLGSFPDYAHSGKIGATPWMPCMKDKAHAAT